MTGKAKGTCKVPRHQLTLRSSSPSFVRFGVDSMLVCLHRFPFNVLGIKMSSAFPSTAATPAPSSPPPPSESYLSELDGTAPSLLETTVGTNTFGVEPAWDSIGGGLDRLNLVSWKADVNAHEGVGVEKRGFNGKSIIEWSLLRSAVSFERPRIHAPQPYPPYSAIPPNVPIL